MWRTDPLWDARYVVAKSGVVHFVNEDSEESGGLFVRIGLELRVDLDDERGGNGGEQTGLRPSLALESLSDAQNSRI